MPKRDEKPSIIAESSEPLGVEKIDPILRRDLVLTITGLSTSTLYRLVRSGEFPRPVRISVGLLGWRQSAVGRWIAERPEVEDI